MDKLTTVEFVTNNSTNITIYKFHFIWLLILLGLIPIFKYLIGPWVSNTLEKLGDRVLNNFFHKLTEQIDSLKEAIKLENKNAL